MRKRQLPQQKSVILLPQTCFSRGSNMDECNVETNSSTLRARESEETVNEKLQMTDEKEHFRKISQEKMNIFRLIGDLSHLLAILLLLWKIWKTRSCAGKYTRLFISVRFYFLAPKETIPSTYTQFPPRFFPT